jgi:hypothetical protein
MIRVRKQKISENKLLGRASLSRLANKSLWYITISGGVGEGGGRGQVH